jgi:hypothetical protein
MPKIVVKAIKGKPDKLKMHFTIIDETVLPLSSFCQILVETSDKNDLKKKSVQKYIP